jgi:SAM-dependent methyltransferase
VVVGQDGRVPSELQREPDGDPQAPAGSRLDPASTVGADYTERLNRLGGQAWKQRLDVQRPYRWNLRRLNLGRTLDLGCGVGRNLAHLGGNGVGVDHNASSVAVARSRGLVAFSSAEFPSTRYAGPGAFDSLLAAHLIEHMSREEAIELLRTHLQFVRPGGKVVLICPQERGYASDPTHVRFVDTAALEELCEDLGLEVTRRFSFPLPRMFGGIFTYNEFVVVARTPGASGADQPPQG